MNRELPKVYEPQEVEGRIYEMWQQGYITEEQYNAASIKSPLPS